MNPEQIQSIIRLLITVSGPAGAWLISRGFTTDQVTALQTLLISAVSISTPVISLVLKMMKHSRAGQRATAAAMPASDKLAVVEAMPQVQSIVVSDAATGAVAQAVADPERPKVVMSNGLQMAGGRDGM